VAEQDAGRRDIRPMRPCFRGRPRKARAATVFARQQDLADARPREPDAVRRRPPKRKVSE
jgi:hypothetical protein